MHPDDAYACEHENGSLGKHECWYVLDARGGEICVGQKARSREEFAILADLGRWDALVNRLPIAKGDFFDILPGTVHAIMAGTTLLEIQQSSDITYRVYDYERRQADGSLRETHLAQALDVIDYDIDPPSSGAVTTTEVDGVTDLLESTDFCVSRVRVDGNKKLAQPWPFLCVSVVAGSGFVSCGGAVLRMAKILNVPVEVVCR